MTDFEVLSLIRKGRENARKSKSIAEFLNIPERQVRLIIRDLISEGQPILSETNSPAGYFIARTWSEVKHYTDNLKARGIEDFKRRRDVIRAARVTVPPEQLELIAK